MARNPATKSRPKTAVVMIHGMGEPVPLENIRSFVDTVYARDRSLAAAPGPGVPLTTSIVPDSATGSAELRRITTHDDGPKKRTDFYELYWADIMDDTPITLVTEWIQALLLRAPWRVPLTVRVFSAWLLLWLLAAVVAFLAAAALYPALVQDQPWLDGIGQWLTANRPFIGQVLVGAGVVFLLAGMAKAFFFAKEPSIREVKLFWPALLFAAGAVVWMLPGEIAREPRVWAAAGAFAVGWMMNTFVGPYFGDVVRYVRATPRTVEKRRLVRERGLALLEALHKKRADGSELEDFTQASAADTPAYDRIVIVGHSLGTVVAYDLLQLFWEKHGPTHHQKWQPGAAGMQAALRKCDRYVRYAAPSRERSFRPRVFRARELRAFHARQAQLCAALATADPHWRITDLITLGSPLVHAEFLLTDSGDEVKQGFVERRFAACPPRPDPVIETSMLFAPKASRTLYPHFAAQFAAVKWTNICDEHPVPFMGDLVSGRLTGIFGPGVIEHNVAIRNMRRWPMFRRIFTHTCYWDWDDSYDDPPGTPATETGKNVPEHIRLLREALRLGT